MPWIPFLPERELLWLDFTEHLHYLCYNTSILLVHNSKFSQCSNLGMVCSWSSKQSATRYDLEEWGAPLLQEKFALHCEFITGIHLPNIACWLIEPTGKCSKLKVPSVLWTQSGEYWNFTSRDTSPLVGRSPVVPSKTKQCKYLRHSAQ